MKWYERLAYRQHVRGRLRRIGPTADSVYQIRYFLVQTRWLGVYLHCYHRSDNDTALHDHPWTNISIPLAVGFREIMPDPDMPGPGDPVRIIVRRKPWCWWAPWRIVFRRATARHAIAIDDDKRGQVWSLFIRFRRWRVWGFNPPTGWVPYYTHLGCEPYDGDRSTSDYGNASGNKRR